MSVVGVAHSSFDMFHVGHLRAIRAALERTGDLVLAVASDGLVARRLGRPPKVGEAERTEVLRAFFPDLRIELVDDDDVAGRVGADVRYVCVPEGVECGADGVAVVELPYVTTTSESLRATLEPEVLWPPMS